MNWDFTTEDALRRAREDALRARDDMERAKEVVLRFPLGRAVRAVLVVLGLAGAVGGAMLAFAAIHTPGDLSIRLFVGGAGLAIMIGGMVLLDRTRGAPRPAREPRQWGWFQPRV